MKRLVLCLMLAVPAAWAASLPDWAKEAVAAAKGAEAPEEGVWVLYDETRITLARDGRFRHRRRTVRRVVSGDGRTASVYAINGDTETTKIKKLKGWHLKDGEVTKIDRNNVVSFSSRDMISSELSSVAVFLGVEKDSVVAFECDELIDSYFPRYSLMLLGAEPALKRVIILDDKDRGTATLLPANLDTWGLTYTLADSTLTLTNLPALADEAHTPAFVNPYPRVLVGLIKKGQNDDFADWDSMARYHYRIFERLAWGGKTPDAAGKADLAALQTSAAELWHDVTYRQVYLSAARGWEPIAAAEVLRLGYGDCKDMSGTLIDKLHGHGFSAFPALAAIGQGFRPEPEMEAQPAFDHVIVAVRLPESLGLAAEVVVDGTRYLLIDATDDFTPVGELAASHRGRQVMICTPEGARWARIPDAAVRPAGVSVSIQGQIDAAWTLQGVLELEERGNAWGLQVSGREGNTLKLRATVIDALDIPGGADLSPVSQSVTEDGRLKLTYSLSWPMFLLPDRGGRHLPYGLTGNLPPRLHVLDKARVQPLYLEETPEYRLHLQLAVPAPMTPGLAEASHSAPMLGFDWKASGGQELEVTFTTFGKAAYWSRADLADGQAVYGAYRRAFDRLLLHGALFFSAPAG